MTDQHSRHSERLRAMLLGSGDRRPEILRAADELRSLISPWVDIVCEDFQYQKDLTSVDAQLAIVLGGDGSILRAARQMGDRQRPVLGINLGRLGFLADLLPDDLPTAMQDLVEGRYRVIDHLMLQCRVIRDDRTIAQTLGLNELAVLGGPPFTIQTIELYVDGELATTYSCDGLIISTAVGSTAHNLSAGGPILRKDLQAFVITPISPHTLTVRPVVDTAARVFHLSASQPDGIPTAMVDGHVLTQLQPTDKVEVRRSDSTFQLIEIHGHSYYLTLREKLGWGGGRGRTA